MKSLPGPEVALSVLLLVACGSDITLAHRRSVLEVLVTVDGNPVEDARVAVEARDPTIYPFGRTDVHTNSFGVARLLSLYPTTYTLKVRHDDALCARPVVTVPPDAEVRHHEECHPNRILTMISTGFLEFDRDTVHMSIGDTINTRRRQLHEHEALPEPGPGRVFATFLEVRPKVFSCTDVPREIEVPFMAPGPCPTVVDHLRSTRPDTLFIPDESMLETITRFLPCAFKEPGTGGGLAECVWWAIGTVETGPGISRDPTPFVADGCGPSWLTYTKRNGWREPWPEPFDTSDRIEVIIAC